MVDTSRYENKTKDEIESDIIKSTVVLTLSLIILVICLIWIGFVFVDLYKITEKIKTIDGKKYVRF